MDVIKRIALVAHDHRKKDLIEWVEWNYEPLRWHKFICTGTTGKMIEKALILLSNSEHLESIPKSLPQG